MLGSRIPTFEWVVTDSAFRIQKSELSLELYPR